MKEQNRFIYRHIRKDKNQPFYIGQGKRREVTAFAGPTTEYARAYETTNRNKTWTGIVNRTEYEVEIMLDNLTEEEANQKEIEFVALYGKIVDGKILANYADGGEVNSGHKMTEEWKRKQSEARKGHIVTQETRDKISKAQKGRDYPIEWRNKLSLVMKEKYAREGSPNKGRKATPRAKRNMSIAHKGLMMGAKNPKSKQVVNTATGEVFESANMLAKQLNICTGSLSEKLRSNKPGRYNTTTFIYLEDYLPYQ